MLRVVILCLMLLPVRGFGAFSDFDRLNGAQCLEIGNEEALKETARILYRLRGEVEELKRLYELPDRELYAHWRANPPARETTWSAYSQSAENLKPESPDWKHIGEYCRMLTQMRIDKNVSAQKDILVTLGLTGGDLPLAMITDSMYESDLPGNRRQVQPIDEFAANMLEEIVVYGSLNRDKPRLSIFDQEAEFRQWLLKNRWRLQEMLHQFLTDIGISRSQLLGKAPSPRPPLTGNRATNPPLFSNDVISSKSPPPTDAEKTTVIIAPVGRDSRVVWLAAVGAFGLLMAIARFVWDAQKQAVE